jgi:signal transduction histidine kinase
LRQALENLLSNAVKHSPRGGRVEISVRERPPEHPDVVAITVRDEGPGIAPELMPRLFQRFMASGPGGGIGLGLYMAREIALAHGGTLTAASEPGAGAAFTLTLPIGEP